MHRHQQKKPIQQFAINKLNPKINQRSNDTQTQFASNQDILSSKPKNKSSIIQNQSDNLANIENVNFVKPVKKEKIDYNSILASL